MTIKRITVNVSEAEYAELVRRARVNRRALADEAGLLITVGLNPKKQPEALA